MNLTTLARVKTMGDVTGNSLDAELKQLIRSISKQIENSPLFDRYIERKERTEYFDVDYAQPIISVKGMPIDEDTAPLVYHDTARSFASGSLVDAGNYYVKADRGLFKFDRYTLSAGVGAVKIVYTGGLSESVNRMVATFTTLVGTLTGTVTGGTSGATGTIVSVDQSNLVITIDVLTGEFEEGETLTATGTCVLNAITQNPIVMAYPDLALACEIQVNFLSQRKHELGQRSSSMEGGTITTYQTADLLPEVKRIIKAYRRIGDVS